jgi:hypothetical protein
MGPKSKMRSPRLAYSVQRRSFGRSGFAVNSLCKVTGTLSDIVVLDVDGPEGEAEPSKYRHPPTLWWEMPAGCTSTSSILSTR